MRKVTDEALRKVEEESKTSSDFIGGVLAQMQVTNPDLHKFLTWMKNARIVSGDSFGGEMVMAFACYLYRLLEVSESPQMLPKLSPEVLNPIWNIVKKGGFRMNEINGEIIEENVGVIMVAESMCDHLKEKEGLSDKEAQDYLLPGLLVYHLLKKQEEADKASGN